MDLVTGATGHIGNVLVRDLVSQGRRVRALVMPGEDRRHLLDLPIEIIEGNVLDPKTLQRAMQGVEVVFHLAGVISILPGKNEKVRQINVEGTRNVLAAARECGVRRVVYTSSIHALKRVPEGILMDEQLPFDPNNPVGAYDRSKAEASLLVLESIRLFGQDAVIVCPTGVIGPFDFLGSEMGALISSWLKHGISLVVEGAYDFVDVRDVARGMILAAERGQTGKVYILSGEQVEINSLQELVRTRAGIKPQSVKVPYKLALFFAGFTPLYCRLTGSKPRFTRYSLVTVTGNSTISSARAQQELGYNPRSLAESVRDTVNWFLNRRLGN